MSPADKGRSSVWEFPKGRKEYNKKQIAETLYISERTVETHRKNIFRKTNTNSVIGLVKYAYEHKLI